MEDNRSYRYRLPGSQRHLQEISDFDDSSDAASEAGSDISEDIPLSQLLAAWLKAKGDEARQASRTRRAAPTPLPRIPWPCDHSASLPSPRGNPVPEHTAASSESVDPFAGRSIHTTSEERAPPSVDHTAGQDGQYDSGLTPSELNVEVAVEGHSLIGPAAVALPADRLPPELPSMFTPYEREREAKRNQLAARRKREADAELNKELKRQARLYSFPHTTAPRKPAGDLRRFNEIIDELCVHLDSPFALTEEYLPSFYHLLPHRDGQIDLQEHDELSVLLQSITCPGSYAPHTASASPVLPVPELLPTLRANVDGVVSAAALCFEHDPVWQACEVVVQSMLQQLVATGVDPQQLAGLATAEQPGTEEGATSARDALLMDKASAGSEKVAEDLPARLGDLPNAPFGERPPFAWWQLIRPAILELAELTGREFFSYAEILQSIQSKFLYFVGGENEQKAMKALQHTLRLGKHLCFTKRKTRGRFMFGCDPYANTEPSSVLYNLDKEAAILESSKDDGKTSVQADESAAGGAGSIEEDTAASVDAQADAAVIEQKRLANVAGILLMIAADQAEGSAGGSSSKVKSETIREGPKRKRGGGAKRGRKRARKDMSQAIGVSQTK